MNSLLWIRISAILLACAVILGAFGAHALKSKLEATNKVDVWQTAVLYQFVHALGILLIAVIMMHRDQVQLNCSAWMHFIGILFFSGSLYLLALGGPRWCGMVTPIGGVFFILGWLTLACVSFVSLKG